MPVPRVFVSSTCYDLRDIRVALRQYIVNFGFEPVMSEFGDIFYDYEQHVQDACITAIEKSNIFLLIVGNQYGSIYHHQANPEIPNSVTLAEFKKALSVNIPKHIFVSKFLNHDYQNFSRYFQEKLKQYFSKNNISDEDTIKSIQHVRQSVDNTYPFPQPSYKYIFHFLDVITELKVNNAVFQFEDFDDITEQLRRQWAGFMYEALTTSQNVPSRIVQEFTSRFDNLENIIRQMVVSKTEREPGQISLNIEDISKSLAPAELQQAQDVLLQSLNCFIQGEYKQERGYMTQAPDVAAVKTWIESLGQLLSNYKWAKSIPFTEVFTGLKVPLNYYTKRDQEIPTIEIMRLYGLYQNLPEQEHKSFAQTVLLKLNPIIRPESEDDIPF